MDGSAKYKEIELRKGVRLLFPLREDVGYSPLGKPILLPLRVEAASGALDAIRDGVAGLAVSKKERSKRDHAADAVARAQAELA